MTFLVDSMCDKIRILLAKLFTPNLITFIFGEKHEDTNRDDLSHDCNLFSSLRVSLTYTGTIAVTI